MRFQNYVRSGLLYDIRDSDGFVLSLGSSTAWYNTVSPGTLVRGNFHDPNNWNYIIHWEKSFHGQIRRHEGVSGLNHTLKGPFGSNSDHMDLPTWERTLVYNRALEKLNSKIRGDLDLSIDIAEAGTTGRMIKSIRNVIGFARSGRWRSTKTLADGWLQWTYGWKPLISDVFDVCDEEQRLVRKRLTNVKTRVTMPLRVTGVRDKLIHGVVGVPVKRNGQGKQSCTLALTLEPRGFDIDQWSSLNPVSLAWEIIPYSFVVDWFLDVGSYLRNLESGLLYGPSFVSGYKSELFAYQSEEVAMNKANGFSSGPDGAGTTEKILDVVGSTRRVDFFRTKLTSYPLPRLPTFKVDLGSSRLTSAAALLRQLLK